MSEKIGGAKGTEMDDEFVVMEKVNVYYILYYVVWLSTAQETLTYLLGFMDVT